MAEKPRTVIAVTVIFFISDILASGRTIFAITWLFLAPDERTASRTPLSTSENEASASLPKKAAAAIVSGTITAFDPIFVPTIMDESGRKKIIRIRNGIELIIFDIKPTI